MQTVIKIRYIFLLLTVLLTGCATTRVTSYFDPEYADEPYKKPVVWGRISPLEDRLLLENNIIDSFRSKGINPVAGVKVFPPGKEIKREYIVPAFLKSNGDSLFIISLKPGSTLHHMQYEATLYGNKLHKVWLSSVITELQQAGISSGQTNALLFKSVADEIVNQLLEDGIIQ